MLPLSDTVLRTRNLAAAVLVLRPAGSPASVAPLLGVTRGYLRRQASTTGRVPLLRYMVEFLHLRDLHVKVIGCSSLRGGGGELDTNKNLDLRLQLVCKKIKQKHAI